MAHAQIAQNCGAHVAQRLEKPLARRKGERGLMGRLSLESGAIAVVFLSEAWFCAVT